MLHVCCSIRTFVVLAFALIFSGVFCQAAMTPSNSLKQMAVSQQNSANTNSQIKSYREWKQSKVQDAEGRVKNLKDTLLRSKGLSLSATEAGLSQSLQGMLDKEEMQYSLAQDLTISDYFVGYLTKQKSIGQAIKEVSGRLSPEEVADLMTAYAEHFFNSKPPTATQPSRADSGL